jgi:YD repeat-containing protein
MLRHWIQSCARTSAAVASLAFCSLAHNVFPNAVQLRPGGEDYFFVVDQGVCPATITVRSTNPSLVQVFAVNMSTGAVQSGDGTTASTPNRIDQVFLVRAAANVAAAQATTIEVCWVGSNFPAPPCNENNCNPYSPHIVQVQVEPDAGTSGATLSSSFFGDPVNAATGEFVLFEPFDFDLGGPLPLRFGRYYASRLVAEGNHSSTLGPNWLHSFAWRLVRTGNNLEVYSNTGRVIRFEKRYLATSWSLVGADDAPYRIAEAGAGFSLADTLAALVYSFDSQGRLTRVEDGRGAAHTLGYTGANLATVSDGLGRVLTLTHNGQGRLSSVSDGARSATFGYDGNGRLGTATDTNSKTTTYAYSAGQPSAALMTSRTLPRGNTPLTLTYDANGRVATHTDAAGGSYTLAYNAPANTTTITDPDAGVQVHDHDAALRLTSLVDESGASVAMGNDARGRRNSVEDRAGRTTSWTFNATSGAPGTLTESNGAQTSFGYGSRTVAGVALHDLTSLSRADGRTESFTLSSGNTTVYRDAAGADWTFTHNAHGQVLTATNPSAGVTTYTYNADGTLATLETPAGALTSFAYDARKRVSTVTHPGGATTTYTYDARDRVLTRTNELGEVVAQTYDDNGNLATLVDAEGKTWTFGYDALDRLVSIEDPLGATANATFDDFGRLATASNGAGEALSFAYDERSRLTSITDGLGRSTSTEYNAEGIPTTRTDAAGNSGVFTTNAAGLVTRLTTPLGNSTNLAYDSMGRRRSVTEPGGAASSVTFDERGLPKSATLAVNGATSSLTRNEFGSVTSATLPGGRVWQRAYDAQGRLTSSTDPAGATTTFTRDARGRIDVATLPGGLGSVDYDFDGAGRLTRRAASDGTAIDYVRDAVGRVLQAGGESFVYDDAGRMTDSNGLGLGYDDANRVTSVTYAPGKTVTYAYDGAGRLVSVADWIGGSTLFEHDAVGRVTRILRPNGVESLFEYDADGEVVELTEQLAAPAPELGPLPLSHIGLVRNARGDITSAMRSFDYFVKPSPFDCVQTFNALWQPDAATYDALGRRTEYSGIQTQWDGLGRVRDIVRTSPVGTTMYDWGGFDLPVARDESGVTTDYDWNYAFARPALSKSSVGGLDSSYYVYTPKAELLYRIDAASDGRQYYHFDEMGSTLFRSDDAGDVTVRYSYTPTGQLTGKDVDDDDPFTYLGRYGGMRVSDADLYFFAWLHKRFYDAKLFAFLSRSSQVRFDPQGSNPYQFANGNPLRYSAPTLSAGRSHSEFTYSAEGEVPGAGPIYATPTFKGFQVGVTYAPDDDERLDSYASNWTVGDGAKLKLSAGAAWAWGVNADDSLDSAETALPKPGESSTLELAAQARVGAEPTVGANEPQIVAPPLPRNHIPAVYKFRTIWMMSWRMRPLRDPRRTLLDPRAFLQGQVAQVAAAAFTPYSSSVQLYERIETQHYLEQLSELQQLNGPAGQPYLAMLCALSPSAKYVMLFVSMRAAQRLAEQQTSAQYGRLLPQ